MAQGSFWQRLISFFSGRKEKETSVSVSDKTSPQGTPEAQVTPEVQATPEPQPVPVPQPAPQPAPVPQPAPQPAPVPQPAPQPQAQPVSTPEGSVADGVLKATAVTPVGESSRIFINRELSWLSFNERVLEEAENKQNPFCERLNFACIYQTNLDEFFMVRVGTLLDQIQVSPLQTDGKTNMTAQQQVDAILDRVHRIISRRDALYNSLMAELEEQGLRVVDFHKIGEKESSALEKYFDANVFPFIEPNIVSQKQPFPFLKNKTIYACAVLETKSGKERLGIIPCDTDVFRRLITVGGGAYMLSEELILHFIPKIFSGYKVVAKSLIRVTRNADIDADAMYDEDLDYREFMAGIIKKRKKLQPVRLELSRELEDKMVDVLCAYLDISRSQVFYNREPLDLTFVYTLSDALRQKTELFYTHRVPQRSAQFDTRQSILDQVAQSDKLLFYPYQSFTTFLNFLDEAAQDENVTAIRITLYRVARDSKVVEALIDAAENGKKVLVLVELKARFDEENNIEWSRRLENAGCRVIYGIPGYKVHSKLCLVTRRLNGQNQYLTQIGTGNYNEKTARLYSDLCLFTANQEIGLDALHVFEALTIGETVETSKHLLVAPKCLKNRVLDMIDGQIARQQKTQDGYIGIKLNSLTDKNIMDKLIEASQAGVKIDMVIRGICCLRPGLSGQTDNIRVVSIVGRFLEHARIYIFGRPTPDDPEGDQIYIASADFMTRNTERRVEVGAPILDPSVKDRLRRIFGAMLSDNVQARQMNADGTYTRVQNGQDPMNCQEYFYEKAYEENHEPLPETVR